MTRFPLKTTSCCSWDLSMMQVIQKCVWKGGRKKKRGSIWSLRKSFLPSPWDLMLVVWAQGSHVTWGALRVSWVALGVWPTACARWLELTTHGWWLLDKLHENQNNPDAHWATSFRSLPPGRSWAGESEETCSGPCCGGCGWDPARKGVAEPVSIAPRPDATSWLVTWAEAG